MQIINTHTAIMTAALIMIVSMPALANCELDTGYQLPKGVGFGFDCELDMGGYINTIKNMKDIKSVQQLNSDL